MVCRVHEGETSVGVDPQRGHRCCPSRADIDERVHVETIRIRSVVDRVNLNENTGLFGQWPGRIVVPLLPARKATDTVTPEHAFHRRKADHSAFLPESMVEDFGALISLPAHLEDTTDETS